MKVSTRDSILENSKKLFSKKGISNISLRQIAAGIGISQGNLNYYFKKKEDILNELYKQFVEKLAPEFEWAMKQNNGFIPLFRLAHKTFEIQSEYKFLIVDLHYLNQEYPDIKKSIYEIKFLRINNFKSLFKIFIEKGYARKEEYETEYDELALRLYLLGVYSILALPSDSEMDNKKLINEYISIVMSPCYPYFTKMGKIQYLKTLEEYVI